MAGFSRTNWYRKNRGIVPGKPAKKGAPLKGLLIISTYAKIVTLDSFGVRTDPRKHLVKKKRNVKNLG